jgi:hypothetical protein
MRNLTINGSLFILQKGEGGRGKVKNASCLGSFMTEPTPQKPALNLWGVVLLLLMGMAAGIGMTLWVVQRFGVGAAPHAQSSPSITSGEGKQPKDPRSQPGEAVPGTVPQAAAIATQISNDGQFRFTLQSCRRIEDGVFCELQITNLTDKEIFFVLNGSNLPKTLAYTDNGLEFAATSSVLGSQSGYLYAQQTLVSQIPTPASFTFQGMPQTSQLSLLKIGYRYRSLETGQWVDSTLEFRPVPLIN